MKKILLWGTGKACKSYGVLFKDLEQKGKLEVVAHVLSEGESQLSEWTVITEGQVPSHQFDQVVIGTNVPELEQAKQTIRELGIPDEKVCSLSGCILEIEQEEKKHQEIVQHQLEVLKKILDASDEEVSDPEWMYRTIGEFGVYPFDTKGNNEYYWTHFGLMQIMEEFTEFCCNISGLKDIHKAIEVGVYRGRSSYFMCALLSRNNPDLEYNCVDISDNLDCFEQYREVLPALVKRIPGTSEDYKGVEFDFVFIDADHSYDGSIADYFNVGQYAKRIAAFHDIYGHEYDHENGGTVRSWREVMEKNRDKEIKIYSYYPDEWMGIGCIIHSREQ